MLRLRVLTSDASESSVADSTCASTVALTARSAGRREGERLVPLNAGVLERPTPRGTQHRLRVVGDRGEAAGTCPDPDVSGENPPAVGGGGQPERGPSASDGPRAVGDELAAPRAENHR